MGDPLNYPKLRWPIDFRVEKLPDQEVLVVSCPLGIAPKPLGLIRAVAPIIAAFEGNRSIEELASQFANYGATPELIRNIATLLDDNLYLATPKFFAAEQNIRASFAANTTRPAFLEGVSYTSDAQELERTIAGYLAHGQQLTVAPSERFVGLVAPHIDYRRGEIGYGKAYRPLNGDEHDLIILIGTAHQYSRHLFHLTQKDFVSPLGTLPCDRDFVTALANRYGRERSFADEILHRREHSLELQLPFLSHLRVRAAIVPILVGGFHELVRRGESASVEPYESFVGALAELVAARRQAGQRVCFVSGVDMAHVGRHFGDAQSLTPEFMDQVRARDQIYLERIMAQDRRGLLAHIAEDDDARKICGFPTLYTVLDVFERLGIRMNARVTDYRQAVDYSTDCAVTFAGMAMYES